MPAINNPRSRWAYLVLFILVGLAIPQVFADRREAFRGPAQGRWERERDHGRNRDWGFNRQRGAGYAQLAFSQGYQDGFDKGREDIRKRRSFSLSRHGRYRDADHGYKSKYGNKSLYRSAYRDGFEQGYREGYRRSWRR